MGTRLRNIGLGTIRHVAALPVALLLLALIIVVGPLMLVWEGIRGDWLRRRRLRSRMIGGRPPLSDSDYLQAVNADEADAPLWLGVRSSAAEYCALPPEAIHPGDPMSDIWWIGGNGPDFFDMVFRLQGTFGVKIPRGDLDSFWREMMRRDNLTFREFAELIVRALRQIKEAEPNPPTERF